MKETEWRNGLLDLYQSQINGADEFMTAVLKESIRKLKETDIHPSKIEDWVVNLEIMWRKML
jgi:hypothetical protein